ncbi:MAG: SDR family oxidoreductase [Acidimicrobiia bacterium]|nr:SDR family oxidoreductase [Acidimicrobiia bacterium]
MTVALITGSNSGIGRGTALELARRGWEVYGSMRDLSRGDKLAEMAGQAGVTVHPVQLDITDDASVRAAVAEVTEKAGRIDVLVNNAGIGGNAVTEECPIELYQQVMDANLYGAIRCIQAVLPQMRERREGAIVNISSIVGRVAHVAQSPYYVSKWALEAMSEGLAQEVAPFGLRVAIVEPGVTKSAIFAKNIDAPNQTGAYDDHYRRMFQFYKAGIPQATPAEEVGRTVFEAVTTDQPKLRWGCSWGAEGLLGGRAAMSDEDWVALGAAESDDEYYARFEEHFALDIRP